MTKQKTIIQMLMEMAKTVEEEEDFTLMKQKKLNICLIELQKENEGEEL